MPMFKTAELDTKLFQKVVVKNQEVIVAKWGKKLVPRHAYDTLRTETNDFNLNLPKAQEVDTLLWDLLKRDGLVEGKGGSTAVVPQSRPPMPSLPPPGDGDPERQRERERMKMEEDEALARIRIRRKRRAKSKNQ